VGIVVNDNVMRRWVLCKGVVEGWEVCYGDKVGRSALPFHLRTYDKTVDITESSAIGAKPGSRRGRPLSTGATAMEYHGRSANASNLALGPRAGSSDTRLFTYMRTNSADNQEYKIVRLGERMKVFC